MAQRFTKEQRKAQAATASANIDREALRIQRETGCSMGDAYKAVYNDADLLARCHAVPLVGGKP